MPKCPYYPGVRIKRALRKKRHGPMHWCSHSFYFKAYQPRIGVNRSGGLFTENTVCIFYGPRKHVDLLGTDVGNNPAIRAEADADSGKQRTCSKRPRKWNFCVGIVG